MAICENGTRRQKRAPVLSSKKATEKKIIFYHRIGSFKENLEVLATPVKNLTKKLGRDSCMIPSKGSEKYQFSSIC